MKIHAIGALLGAALCLSACSGGSETGGSPPAGLTAPAALLHLTLTIPKPSAVSTKSVVIAAGANMLGVFDTTAQSNGCGTLSGATVCTFLLHVPMGHVVLRITGFDQTGGGGRTMCAGDVMVGTIPKSAATIRVILGGVVAGVSIGIPDAGPAGTAQSVPVVVMAKDADGNVIVGSELYSTPISVTDEDKTGATALSLNNAAPTSAVHVRSASDSLKLIYNGGDVTTATIDADAAPATSADAAFSPVPTVVATYPMPFSDGTPTEPGVVAKGKDGALWVYYFGLRSNGFAKMTPGGAFNVFARNVASEQSEVVYSMVTAAPGSPASVWFTANTSRGRAAGNIAPNGAVVEYPFPAESCGNAANFGDAGIVSDGGTGYWIAMSCSSSTQLAHVTANGIFTLSRQFPQIFAESMIRGLDGKLYLAGQDNDNNKAMVAQISVDGSSVSGVSMLDTNSITWSWGSIAQTPNGEIWLTTSDNFGNAWIGRMHIAATFSNSSVVIHTEHNVLSSTTVPLPDNSVWVANDYPPEADHMAGGSGPDAIVPLQTLPFSSLSQGLLVVGGAVGADKDLYFAGKVDPNTGSILKVAY